MPKKRKYSRLSKTQRKKYSRQTFLLSILTLALIISIIFWGIPALIRVAIFLADINSTTQPISGEDTIPPPPPVLQPIADATNSAQIKIEGFAEEGSTIILSINGSKKYETLVESDGEFLFKQVTLENGENEISAKSIDEAGNESHYSSSQKVTFDSEVPELEIFSPDDGKKYFGTSEQQLVVSGKAEQNTSITINGFYVILKPDNTFTYKLSLTQGENLISVVARDDAGNEAVINLTVFFEE